MPASARKNRTQKRTGINRADLNRLKFFKYIPCESPYFNLISCDIVKKMIHDIGEEKTGRDKGFTLIEVMIAVTILALISAIIFAVVFGAAKRSRFIDLELSLQTETSLILSLVAEDIRGAFSLEGEVPFFVGEDRYFGDVPGDRVDFLTSSVLPTDPELSSGSGGEVGYSVFSSDEKQFSLLRREQAPLSEPFDEGGQEWEVTDRLASFELAYSDGEEWFDQWDSTIENGPGSGKLPTMVRISLSLKEGVQEVSATTIVTPVISSGK